VSGGRGASAAADWAANKTIALPDTDPGHTHTATFTMGGNTAFGSLPYAGSVNNNSFSFSTNSSTTGITINPSGGQPHRTLQPTMLTNIYIKL
jgi:hypothetical protein